MGLFELFKKKMKDGIEAIPTQASQVEDAANKINERVQAPPKKERQNGIGGYLMQKYQELAAKAEAERNYVLDYKPSVDYVESAKDFSELSEVLRGLIHDYAYKGEQNRRYLDESNREGDYYDELDRLDELKIGRDVTNKDEIRLLYKAREENVFYLVDEIVAQRKIRERIDKEALSILTWKDTSGMPNAIQLPPDTKMIHDGIFNECQSLKEVDLSGCKQLTRVGTEAFYGCKSLSTLKLAQSITTIDESAFWRCALEKLDFPCCCNLQSVGKYAFAGNPLGSVDFSVCPQLTNIYQGVLSRCEKLEYVTLPEALSEFHSLGNCKALSSVDMTKCTNLRVLSEPILSEPILWRSWIDENNESCYWGTVGEEYKGRNHMYKVVVPSGVTHIEPAFFEHIDVFNLYLPPTLKECKTGAEYYKDGDYRIEREKHYKNVYCYSTDCVDSLLELSYACERLYIMPELYERKDELFEGGDVKTINKIRENELDFYDKLYSK